MSPLTARKQLLIAESEINRVRLRQEWETLANGVGNLADRAKSFNTMAAAVVSLVAALGAFTRSQPAAEAAKTSWLQKIAGGVRLASSLWLIFRSRGSASKTEQP